MTEDDIKEGISRAYVECLAAHAAFNVETARKDYGLDLTLRANRRVVTDGRTEYLPMSESLSIQLKCTTTNSIYGGDGSTAIGYDLSVRNYNHLVRWWSSAPAAPAYLILFVLPADPSSWIRLTTGKTSVRRAAYWWAPDVTTSVTANKRAKRIWIPVGQQVTPGFFNDRVQAFY